MCLTEELKKQTVLHRSQTIDTEEVMGMFSAAQQKGNQLLSSPASLKKLENKTSPRMIFKASIYYIIIIL